MTANFTNIFFTHYAYLNGERLEINPEEFKHEQIDNISLKLIKTKLGSRLPNDSIILFRGDEGYDEMEEETLTLKNFSNIFGFQFFSKSLFEEKNFFVNINHCPFTNLKLLEEKKYWDIYEYPQEKEGNDFITILTFRELDNYINGFLNFLFDIGEDSNYKLKLEDKIFEKKNLFIMFIYELKKEILNLL